MFQSITTWAVLKLSRHVEAAVHILFTGITFDVNTITVYVAMLPHQFANNVSTY